MEYVCDFCASDSPKVVYICSPSKGFTISLPGSKDKKDGTSTLNFESDGKWTACERCEKFVDAKDMDGLLGWLKESHGASEAAIVVLGAFVSEYRAVFDTVAGKMTLEEYDRRIRGRPELN